MRHQPVIAYAPAVQQKLRDLITETAQAKKIPFQRAASCQEPQEQIPMPLPIAMVALLLH